jgi:hypothetical protein
MRRPAHRISLRPEADSLRHSAVAPRSTALFEVTYYPCP